MHISNYFKVSYFMALCLLHTDHNQASAAQVSLIPKVTHRLNAENTHNKFSRSIKPQLRVSPGAVIEVETKDSADNQINLQSTSADLATLDINRVHPLTGPVYVEGAHRGDTLAVTIHKVEIGNWGWSAIFPGFGILSEEFTKPKLRVFKINSETTLRFSDNIHIALQPFPGLLGVAPDTEEMLSTMPARHNGGNMDDPQIRAGTTVYFPVLVEGALFSIGDGHALQGLGEVSGPAVEVPLRVIYEVNVQHDGRRIIEPQYETSKLYAVLASAQTLDEAAKKATRYMVDYLEAEHGLTREDAYMLCTLAADLRIAAVPNKPNVTVAMQISKQIFVSNP